MLVHHAGVLGYLHTALDGMPELCDRLLLGLSEEEADFQPDAERFSIREVMAHLADWDGIFLERMQRARIEFEPVLESIDEGQRALERDYANTDLHSQAQLFRDRRTQMLKFVRSLQPAEWEQCCIHPKVGRVTLEGVVTLVPWHDAYHLNQIVQWRRLFAQQLHNG